MKFSKTSEYFVGELNELARTYKTLAAAGKEVLELCSSISGFAAAPRFPLEELNEEWREGLRRVSAYEPDPMGNRQARDAIAIFCEKRGISVNPEHVLLTCGSSISYHYLFKLLADPGEEILCPVPSYPLFDYIGQMSSVKMGFYPLEQKSRSPFWELDDERLRNCVTTKTKGMVFISPHNPTGYVIDAAVWKKICAIATRFDLPLIHDEVFSEFIWSDAGDRNATLLPRPSHERAPLIFSLNGLSKVFALPGVKLGWILMQGDDIRIEQARSRLEMISDTFLPVNEPVQAALPYILENGEKFIHTFATWAKARLEQSLCLLEGARNVRILKPQAGFYLLLKLNDGMPNADQLSVNLLKTKGVLVHPGSFYEMKGNYLVFSFLHAPDLLEKALPRLVEFLNDINRES